MKKSTAKFMSMAGNVADKYDVDGEYFVRSKFLGGCASWMYYSVLIFSPLVMKQWLPRV